MIHNSTLPFHSVTDDDLCTAVHGVTHNYPLSVLNTLLYKPIDSNHNHFYDDYIFDNLFPDLKCSYHFCDTTNINHDVRSSLNILSFNISSLPRHLDTLFDQCLTPTNMKFHVIGLCETRLNDAISSMYRINGYECYFNNRNTRGGGLAIYLHSMYDGSYVPDLTLQLPHIETIFLHVTRPQKFIVGMLYRPPNASLDDFLVSLEYIMDAAIKYELKCYLLGDFNINLLSNNDHVNNFSNLLFSYMFFPVINKPTRVTETSATLIDNIWTNDVNYHCSGILYSNISDHFPVFSTFSLPVISQNSQITIIKRIINDAYINTFLKELNTYKWEDNLQTVGVQECFDSYMQKFSSLYDKHFPFREFKVKEKHIDKQYITQAIKTSIKERNRLQKLNAKWPITYGAIFRKYRNTLTSIIRAAKINHVKSKIKNAEGDSKNTWNIINGILGRNKNKYPDFIKDNGKILENNEEIAEAFNAHFSNIVRNLNNAEPSTPFTQYLPVPTPYSFFLQPTSQHEIVNVISSLKKTSPGYDDIDITVIKKGNRIISPFLEKIINKSFLEGVFPQSLKIARIVPIYKKGDKSIISNYRPVSILSTFSKIFEKIMAIRLLNYLNEHSLLSSNQYGFRPNFSTELAVQQMCQQMYDAIDNKLYQITIFCDFSKAFDTISHTILLDKLKTFGIRGPAHSWFISYLNNRKQYTVFNKINSSYSRVNTGVPQGSILGPILFLLYINDISRCSNVLNFLLYADDTNLFVKGDNVRDLETIVNTELNFFSEWVKSNKLILNLEKTHFMISHTIMSQPPHLNIKIANTSIKQVNNIKFLGVVIDSSLKWKVHIETIKSKLSGITGLLYNIRDYMDHETLKLIYYSLAYSHIIYCCAVWGGAFKTLITGLFTVQKKMLRVMFRRQRYDHTGPLFNNYQLLSVQDIINLRTCIFVYKSIHLFPIDCMFQTMSRDSSRSQNFRVPLCRTSHAQQSVLVRGCRLWNQLPEDIKCSNTIDTFKRKLKNQLLNLP